MSTIKLIIDVEEEYVKEVYSKVSGISSILRRCDGVTFISIKTNPENKN